MGIGKTLTAIVVAGSIGVGGYFIGKGASEDKEYGIKRDETGVYLQVKPTSDTYEMKMYGNQLVVGNNSDQVMLMYKTKLTDELANILAEKTSIKTSETTSEKKSK